MKYKHQNGLEIDTNNFPDVDQELFEKIKELEGLFGKYDRQFFCVAEIKGSEHTSINAGTVFSNFKKQNQFWNTINYFVKLISEDYLEIKQIKLIS